MTDRIDDQYVNINIFTAGWMNLGKLSLRLTCDRSSAVGDFEFQPWLIFPFSVVAFRLRGNESPLCSVHIITGNIRVEETREVVKSITTFAACSLTCFRTFNDLSDQTSQITWSFMSYQMSGLFIHSFIIYKAICFRALCFIHKHANHQCIIFLCFYPDSLDPFSNSFVVCIVRLTDPLLKTAVQSNESHVRENAIADPIDGNVTSLIWKKW